MTEGPQCNRCGQCCHYIDEGKVKKCRQLLKVGGQFFCRIYANRLGYKIATLHDGTVLYCNLIKNAPTDYADCPYNTGKRPMLDLRPQIK